MVYWFIGSSVYLPLRTLFFNLCSSVCIGGSKAWRFIRAVSGDNAYDLYLARQRERDAWDSLLSPQEFYRRRVERKYNNKDSPARCC